MDAILNELIGNEQVKYFSFYPSFFHAIEMIEDTEEKLEAYRTMLIYGLYGIEPNPETTPSTVMMVFYLSKPNIDSSTRSKVGGKEGGEKGGKNNKKPPFENINNPPSENEITPLTETYEAKRDKDKDIDIESISADAEALPVKPAREHIPYQHIVDEYNSICVSFPKVTEINDTRRTNIRARYKKYGEDKIIDVFRRAEASDWLSGRTQGRRWCGFDWLMRASNFLNITEGKYDNYGKSPPEPDIFADEYI